VAKRKGGKKKQPKEKRGKRRGKQEPVVVGKRGK